MLDLVGNPENKFSQDVAQLILSKWINIRDSKIQRQFLFIHNKVSMIQSFGNVQIAASTVCPLLYYNIYAIDTILHKETINNGHS